MSSICPNSEQLRAFCLGNLDGRTLERLARHVTECEDCDAALHSMDEYSDGLITELRYLEACAASSEQVPQRLIHAARVSGGPLAGRDTEEVTIDAGRRFARYLASGPCRLGKFQLQSQLGVGSFGYVFRAHDPETDRTVAIKIQRTGSLAGTGEADRFLREARTVAQLKHPGIVALYETAHTDDGVYYLVYEFIEGETLENWLKTNCPTFPTVAEYVAELADALQYAHEHGVIHRDIKPSNILVDREGRLHIMDFGLAKLDSADVTETPDGQVMGTPAYMSPEQARGDSTAISARSDVYSLGGILYEMLTGERPFQGNRRMLLLQVLEDEARPPRQLNDRIPRDLETICLKAMSKSPARRYATAGEFADDLRRFSHGDPIHARSMGWVERLGRWCWRYPLAASWLLAVTIGSVIGLWYLSSLNEFFVQQTALNSARMESHMLDAMTAFYSELVNRLEGQNVVITDNYKGTHGALPLPATFTIDAGERISKADTGLQVRLYSRYPWRADGGGAKDEFERRAMEILERNPTQPFHEFIETENGRALVYATARHMEESCIKCHNQSERSPKRDWKVGDVAGVLKIVRSLDHDVERTRQGLWGAFVLMGCSIFALLAVSIAVVMGARARVRAKAQRP